MTSVSPEFGSRWLGASARELLLGISCEAAVRMLAGAAPEGSSPGGKLTLTLIVTWRP